MTERRACGLFLVAGLWWLVSIARADFRLAPLFTDGAVLQREQAIRIWGTAEPLTSVAVAFAGQESRTVAGADGHWRVVLPPLPASTAGRELRAWQGRRETNAIRVRDVVVGDVWVCSGQSNMEFTVRDARDGSHEVATAHEPMIRHLKVARKLSDQPQEAFSATPWQRATPETVGSFTAVGYFFAREMTRETGVPVGLVNCTWSGTSIEPWMSPTALAQDPAFAVVGERWRADLAAYPERRKTYEAALSQWTREEDHAAAKGADSHQQFLKERRKPRPPPGSADHPYPGNPSQIQLGMVHPLRHAAIRGVLWYQGEANAVRATEYGALFRAGIRDWRNTFGRPDLPFYFVQIANFQVDTDWMRLREEQAHALVLSATGMAVTIDIGDPDNIHPANKQEVGRRLSLIALAKLEHRPLEYSGPLFAGAEFAGQTARVRFQHAAALESRDGPPASLELAGEDRRFHPASGKIDGADLIVTSPAVPHPVAVRYAWSAAPRANLYNEAGLPAAPFRSDAW